MAASERVCLLLADLSGYTAYVAASEPEHAPAMAGDLVEAVVNQLRPAFRLEKLEGDAAFLLASMESLDGQRVIDGVTAAYDAFRRRVESLRQATTCDCESCRRVPDLDLKFVVHAGQVVRHKVAGRQEVGGADAILVHRLLKASSPAALGLSRYVLLTDACLAALGLNPDSVGAQAAVESFEYLGEVPIHVVGLGSDMNRVRWAAPARRRPLAEADLELAAAPMTVWGELTSPQQRPGWEGDLQIAQATPDARRGVGNLTSCVANRLSSVEEILEWRPFDAFVRRATIEGVGRLTAQHHLTPSPEGSRTTLRVRWYGPAKARELATAQAARLETLATRLEVARANR